MEQSGRSHQRIITAQSKSGSSDRGDGRDWEPLCRMVRRFLAIEGVAHKPKHTHDWHSVFAALLIGRIWVGHRFDTMK
jgi:hypothetical protein